MPIVDDVELDRKIIEFLYRVVEKALDEFEAGDMKRCEVTLRGILPFQYKHSFEKKKCR